MMWLVSLLMVVMVQAQDTPKLNEETDDDIKDLTKDNGLDLSQSFRCGLFFAGEAGAKPKETLYILPKLFPAECPADDKGDQSFNTFCTNIFNKMSKKITYETPSIYQVRADEGFSIGDDICGLLKRDHGVINVGEENKSKKFPEGLEIGFYYNSCGNKLWTDTTLRHPEGPICCKKGRYKKCLNKKGV